MTRVNRFLLPITFGLLPLGLGLAACSGDGPFQSSDAESTAVVTAETTPATGIAANDFLPEDQNISDCVGTNERPGCGSKSKGGLHLYLVFAALIGGVGFIAWRVSIGIRARDAVVNAIDNETDAGTGDAGKRDDDKGGDDDKGDNAP